jgi:hypothetical protein
MTIMSKAGKRLIEAMDEAVSIANGDEPAPRVYIKGHAYVPETRIAELKRERDAALAMVDQLKKRLAE